MKNLLKLLSTIFILFNVNEIKSAPFDTGMKNYNNRMKLHSQEEFGEMNSFGGQKLTMDIVLFNWVMDGIIMLH